MCLAVHVHRSCMTMLLSSRARRVKARWGLVSGNLFAVHLSSGLSVSLRHSATATRKAIDESTTAHIHNTRTAYSRIPAIPTSVPPF